VAACRRRCTWVPAALLVLAAGCRSAPDEPATVAGQGLRSRAPEKITMTIVYDNNPHDRRLRTAWGFACVVQLQDTTILFDTGGDGAILLSNMQQCGVEPRRIDTVVLSHVHADHVGGLPAFLAENHDVTVVAPASFPEALKQQVRSSGARLKEIRRPEQVTAHVFTTGELGRTLKEQSLVVDTQAGLVVITGCAHPGIIRIIEEAKRRLEREVVLVVGGFHLGGVSQRELAQIVKRFRELGVRHVAPCHCSGDAARAAFKEAYGDACLLAGVGFTVDVQDLDGADGDEG
jgi:7,8-dihydropterin-6-yl-methyl-4-(beta-D-ribofuranosyl)aminobenzene 5'-phosphate synthase